MLLELETEPYENVYVVFMYNTVEISNKGHFGQLIIALCNWVVLEGFDKIA